MYVKSQKILIYEKDIIYNYNNFLICFHNIFETCLPGGIIISTQQQVDDFQTNYPGCIEILGNLEITGTVDDLSGLSVLTSVLGSVTIKNTTQLTSISGLDNIVEIGRTIYIIANHNLRDIGSFSALQEIGTDQSYFGQIRIAFNDSLLSITGFNNLQGNLSDIAISNNLSLQYLDGFNNLDYQFLFFLSIYNNPLLSICNIPLICNLLTDQPCIFNIYNNADGCNCPAEIAQSCGFNMSCLENGNYIPLNPQMFLKMTS